MPRLWRHGWQIFTKLDWMWYFRLSLSLNKTPMLMPEHRSLDSLTSTPSRRQMDELACKAVAQNWALVCPNTARRFHLWGCESPITSNQGELQWRPQLQDLEEWGAVDSLLELTSPARAWVLYCHLLAYGIHFRRHCIDGGPNNVSKYKMTSETGHGPNVLAWDL